MISLKEFDPNEYMKWEDIMEAYPKNIVVLTDYKRDEKHALDGGKIQDVGTVAYEMQFLDKWEISGEDFVIVSTFIGFVPRAY